MTGNHIAELVSVGSRFSGRFHEKAKISLDKFEIGVRDILERHRVFRDLTVVHRRHGKCHRTHPTVDSGQIDLPVSFWARTVLAHGTRGPRPARPHLTSSAFSAWSDNFPRLPVSLLSELGLAHGHQQEVGSPPQPNRG